MKRLEVSSAVRPIYGSLGVKRLTTTKLNTKLKFLPHREHKLKAMG